MSKNSTNKLRSYPSNRRTRRNRQYEQYYYIEGMGCNMRSSKGLKEIFDYLVVIDESNYKCHAKTSAPIRGILNSIAKKTPMQNSTYLDNLVEDILNRAKTKDVYIYGHSYGGAIANRLAEELDKRYEKGILDRIFIAAFGSIYLAKLSNASNVNLVNYIAIGDVSNSATWNIKHIQREPDLSTYTEIKTRTKKITICKYKKRGDSDIFDVCLYLNNKSTCEDYILNIPIFRAWNEWKIHNGYLRLIKYLMMNKTNRIDHVDIPEDIVVDTPSFYNEELNSLKKSISIRSSRSHHSSKSKNNSKSRNSSKSKNNSRSLSKKDFI